MRDQAGHGSETLGARGYLLFGLLDESVIGCLDGEDACEPSPRPAATAAPICVCPAANVRRPYRAWIWDVTTYAEKRIDAHPSRLTNSENRA